MSKDDLELPAEGILASLHSRDWCGPLPSDLQMLPCSEHQCCMTETHHSKKSHFASMHSLTFFYAGVSANPPHFYAGIPQEQAVRGLSF